MTMIDAEVLQWENPAPASNLMSAEFIPIHSDPETERYTVNGFLAIVARKRADGI